VPSIDFQTKPIICGYYGDMATYNPDITNMNIESLPPDCEIIIFSGTPWMKGKPLTVDANLIKQLSSNRTVILQINRENNYNDWVDVLSSDSYLEEAKTLSKFALDNGIKGFRFEELTPQDFNQTLNTKVGINIIPYLCQVKASNDLIIAIDVDYLAEYITNPDVYNFGELNNIVDLYLVNTFNLNPCTPSIYNGRTPIYKIKHGSNCLLSMEEVMQSLKMTNINFDKTYLTVEIQIMDINNMLYTYELECKGSIQEKSICIPNTTDYFQKGSYVKSENCGMLIQYVELDNFDDTCCCGKFIAFRNVLAGFRGQSVIPCPKIDVQNSTIP